jgi:thiol:disulfide interchange protein
VTVERTAHARAPAVKVRFEIPPGHVLYPEAIEVATVSGEALAPLLVPAAAQRPDPFTGEPKPLYDASFDALYVLPPAGLDAVQVGYQGCNDRVCFMPQSLILSLSGTAPPPPAPGSASGEAEPAGGFSIPADFMVRATGTGYQNEEEFLGFLDRASAPAAARARPRGFWATLILVLAGGIALNFTPCVLPMIPINLALIGAGARAASRGRGFFLGSMYGLGMAVAYGALGAGVVLTGSRFGQINASPGFNAAIALLFAGMALAMFDVIRIDLSRFQGGGSAPRASAGVWAVFGLGAIAALLAGACVAPVVISVLLLAGAQVAAGNQAGLLWPFLLGVGMALPWPLAGAGLARLPKPGAWMNRVKVVFGVFILLMALYYGNLARQLWAARGPVGEAGADGPSADWNRVWAEARAQRKPVFVDFWASWCKNCEAMEKTTFTRPAVRARLEEFVVVKYRAERMGDPPARPVLDAFEVRGLPTYVILVPE